jgi:hypothetical protein
MQVGRDRRQHRQDRERTDRRDKTEHDRITGNRREFEIFFCFMGAVRHVRWRYRRASFDVADLIS